MIGFVTWPPFFVPKCYKGGQVTKPIILVKICYKLLYVIQLVEIGLVSNFLASADIRSHMPVCNVASDWPRTFLHPRCFCLALKLTYVYHGTMTGILKLILYSML